jgi:hypothetical protein
LREFVTDRGEERTIDGVKLLGSPFAGKRQTNGKIIDGAEVASLGRSTKEGVEEFPSLSVSKFFLEGISVYGHGRIDMVQEIHGNRLISLVRIGKDLVGIDAEPGPCGDAPGAIELFLRQSDLAARYHGRCPPMGRE